MQKVGFPLGCQASCEGLEPGDRITGWDGQRIAGYYDLVLKINDARPGQTVHLGVVRRNRAMTVAVTLGEGD